MTIFKKLTNSTKKGKTKKGRGTRGVTKLAKSTRKNYLSRSVRGKKPTRPNVGGMERVGLSRVMGKTGIFGTVISYLNQVDIIEVSKLSTMKVEDIKRREFWQNIKMQNIKKKNFTCNEIIKWIVVNDLAKHIISLDLGDCELIDNISISNVAKNCPGLKTLSVFDCYKVSDLSIIKIATQCSALTSIDLRFCNITAESIDKIGDLKELATLYIGSDFKRVTNPLVARITEKHNDGSSFKKLTKLDLGDCSYLDKIVFRDLMNGIGGQLTSLNISRCSELGYFSLDYIGDNCKKLSLLNLQYLKTTDKFFKLATGCKLLTSLNLFGNGDTVTDETIRLFADNCKNLKHLDVGECKLTHDAIVFLTACPKLERLGIVGVTSEESHLALSELPKLKFLKCSLGINVTRDELEGIMAAQINGINKMVLDTSPPNEHDWENLIREQRK
jgi:hypothetical protein